MSKFLGSTHKHTHTHAHQANSIWTYLKPFLKFKEETQQSIAAHMIDPSRYRGKTFYEDAVIVGPLESEKFSVLDTEIRVQAENEYKENPKEIMPWQNTYSMSSMRISSKKHIWKQKKKIRIHYIQVCSLA